MALVNASAFNVIDYQNVVKMGDSPLYMECLESYDINEKVV